MLWQHGIEAALVWAKALADSSPGEAKRSLSEPSKSNLKTPTDPRSCLGLVGAQTLKDIRAGFQAQAAPSLTRAAGLRSLRSFVCLCCCSRTARGRQGCGACRAQAAGSHEPVEPGDESCREDSPRCYGHVLIHYMLAPAGLRDDSDLGLGLPAVR